MLSFISFEVSIIVAPQAGILDARLLGYRLFLFGWFGGNVGLLNGLHGAASSSFAWVAPQILNLAPGHAVQEAYRTPSLRISYEIYSRT